MFDRGNGPTGSCMLRDRVGVRAESRVGVWVVEGRKEREVREGRRGETGCDCWRRSRESVCSQAPLFTQRGEASPTSSEVAQPQKSSLKTIRTITDPFR